MISVSDVYAALCTYESSEGYTGEDLFPCCEQGLRWVRENLRDSADEKRKCRFEMECTVENLNTSSCGAEVAHSLGKGKVMGSSPIKSYFLCKSN